MHNSNQPAFSRQAGGIYGPAFSTERVDAAGCAPKQQCCGVDNYTDAFGSGDDDEGFENEDHGGRGLLPICRKRKPCRNPPKKTTAKTPTVRRRNSKGHFIKGHGGFGDDEAYDFSRDIMCASGGGGAVQQFDDMDFLGFGKKHNRKPIPRAKMLQNIARMNAAKAAKRLGRTSTAQRRTADKKKNNSVKKITTAAQKARVTKFLKTIKNELKRTNPTASVANLQLKLVNIMRTMQRTHGSRYPSDASAIKRLVHNFNRVG